jgi:hypothetical protein
MAVPGSIDARLYYRCAFQRYEDAQILPRTAGHGTGAVYLAGYGIECILKALVLSVVKPVRRQSAIQSFRRLGQGHDFEWLRSQYFHHGGARFPRDVNESFTLVLYWSTNLRYEPSTIKPTEADAFMKAAATILRWAGGRL